MKIFDYELVMDESGEELESAVKGLLKHGWQPYGSPFVWKQYGCQAMVKTKTDKKP
jgi:hypothetical protein